VRKNSWHNFPASLLPLDLATLLYVLISGVYLCFSTDSLKILLPHFAVRFFVVFLVFSLSFLSSRFYTNKFLLFVRNLYPLLFLGFFYTETSCMKNIIFSDNLDAWFFGAEQKLWHCQPSLMFSKWVDDGWFNELMNLCYFSYYLLIGFTCIFLYLKKPVDSPKGIFTVTFSFYLYYLIFAVLPVVGPQYYIKNCGADLVPPHFFGRMMHGIITNYEQPTGAFPSSHVGIALIISYISYKYFKKLFFISLPFVVGICFATVYIKAHYLVDVLAGIVSAPLFILLSGSVYHKFLSCKMYNHAQKIEPDHPGKSL